MRARHDRRWNAVGRAVINDLLVLFTSQDTIAQLRASANKGFVLISSLFGSNLDLAKSIDIELSLKGLEIGSLRKVGLHDGHTGVRFVNLERLAPWLP